MLEKVLEPFDGDPNWMLCLAKLLINEEDQVVDFFITHENWLTGLHRHLLLVLFDRSPYLLTLPQWWFILKLVVAELVLQIFSWRRQLLMVVLEVIKVADPLLVLTYECSWFLFYEHDQFLSPAIKNGKGIICFGGRRTPHHHHLWFGGLSATFPAILCIEGFSAGFLQSVLVKLVLYFISPAEERNGHGAEITTILFIRYHSFLFFGCDTFHASDFGHLFLLYSLLTHFLKTALALLLVLLYMLLELIFLV